MDPNAELVVLSGPIAGQCFALTETYVTIGQAPRNVINLLDPAADWEHGGIRTESGRHVLLDFASGRGTFVNGARVSRRHLEDNDQISIGKSVLLYRRADIRETRHEAKPTLLRASAFLYSVRALAACRNPLLQRKIEAHLLRLIADLVTGTAAGGAILLGAGQENLIAQARERDEWLATLIPQVCAGAPVWKPDAGWLVLPVYAFHKLAGILAVPCQGEEHIDALSALATFLTFALESAGEAETLRTERDLLEEQLGTNKGIVGESPSIKRLRQTIDKVAPSDSTALILGESGTGKELVARALHEGSPRRDRPFVVINCAAIIDSLLESELFGHEKGAFTGAAGLKKGRLEMAQGGTLFLDEIGEISAGLQTRLLRVLQQREMVRVGGHQTIRLDVRVVAATNRDLTAAMRQGTFREDLYYRLNVIVLRTPPLREHREDIPLLVRQFLARAATRCRRRVCRIAPEAERCLMRYEWPGNVRELENAIERAVVLAESDELGLVDFPETATEGNSGDSLGVYQESMTVAKRECILAAYERSGGDYKAAAQLLGIHPVYLLRLVRKLGLKEEIRGAVT